MALVVLRFSIVVVYGTDAEWGTGEMRAVGWVKFKVICEIHSNLVETEKREALLHLRISDYVYSNSNTNMSVCVKYSKLRHYIQDCNLVAGPAKYAASDCKAMW